MPKTKEQKREEAIERQSLASQRSIDEQLALLDNRPGDSMRERAALLKIKQDAAADVARKAGKKVGKKLKKAA